jgi:NAD(P)-dependent dehydrogenase (short-subunit alcohol dehydrogenase family)
MRSPVVFEDINFSSRAYDPWLGYGQSKTANVLFAVGATRRWAADGITANAVHPGGILETNLARYLDQEEIARLSAARDEEVTSPINPARIRFKTVEQGAATSVLVATSSQLEGIGARYFEDCNEAVVLAPGASETSTSGVMSYAVDADNAEQLWDVSLEMLGLRR